MDEENLKKLWLDPCNEQQVEINTDKLIHSVMNTISVMEMHIRRRDRIEIVVAVLMIPFFGWLVFTVSDLMGKIGAAIILVNCVVTIYRLNRARRVVVKEELASELKNQLETSLQRVRQQINLSDTILWWYLLPFFVGVMCLTFTSSDSMSTKIVYSIIVVGLYSYIWYLNKRAVRKKLRPIENNIMNAIAELSDPNGEPK